MLLATARLPHVHTDVHMDLGSLPQMAPEALQKRRGSSSLLFASTDELPLVLHLAEVFSTRSYNCPIGVFEQALQLSTIFEVEREALTNKMHQVPR